ncbi:MAG: hypothetical protein WB586_15855 [Chthoniobacterales bacterium]
MPGAGLDERLNWWKGSSAFGIVIENQSQKDNVNKKSGGLLRSRKSNFDYPAADPATLQANFGKGVGAWQRFNKNAHRTV